MKKGPIPKAALYADDPIPLTRADLEKLKQNGRTPPGATPKRLRESYHNIARLTAASRTEAEVAIATGYSRSRITTLLQAPAMKELVALYREKINEVFVENADAFFTLATQNMLAAERHIADRIDELDNADELLPIRDALAISRDAADRFGYGKKQTNVNVNVDFAAQLEKAIKRSGKSLDSVAAPASRQLIDVSPPSQTRRPVGSLQPLLRRRA